MDILFGGKKDCILRLTYEGAGRINRVWRAIQLLKKELICLSDFCLKASIPKQKYKTNISGSTKWNFPFEIFRGMSTEKFGAFTYSLVGYNHGG